MNQNAIPLAQRVRFLLTDPTERRSIGTSLRKRRWEVFRACFPAIETLHVIDLGGTVVHWERSPVKPASVVVVNLLPETSDTDRITPIRGDACALPAALAGRTFDLVYSNSLIEHVGGHERRGRFAANVRALAPAHWVQTPYRYFPIEPHWLFPGLQFLPAAARARAITHWPLAAAKPQPGQALADVLEVELLSVTELAYYFGDSRVLRERVLGLTKSLIAVRSGSG